MKKIGKLFAALTLGTALTAGGMTTGAMALGTGGGSGTPDGHTNSDGSQPTANPCSGSCNVTTNGAGGPQSRQAADQMSVRLDEINGVIKATWTYHESYRTDGASSSKVGTDGPYTDANDNPGKIVFTDEQAKKLGLPTEFTNLAAFAKMAESKLFEPDPKLDVVGAILDDTHPHTRPNKVYTDAAKPILRIIQNFGMSPVYKKAELDITTMGQNGQRMKINVPGLSA